MATQRTWFRPLSIRRTDPFCTTEEAWLWFWRCQLAREEGARIVADAGIVARPCDPDDVYRVVVSLYQRGTLSRDHIVILVQYGRILTPPDERVFEENTDAQRWDEALDQLTPPLQRKGIVT